MSLPTTDDFLMIALYCLPLVVILAVYLSRQRRVHSSWFAKGTPSREYPGSSASSSAHMVPGKKSAIS